MNKPKMLSFPSTRSVLWDQRPKGESTLIHLSEYRNPLLVLEEKTLWLMQRFAAQDTNSELYRCLLLGSVASDPDGEGIQISIDRLDPNVGNSSGDSVPGELTVPCLLKKNAARSDLATSVDYSADIKALHERVLAKEKVDLGRFIALRAYCSYHASQENHIFHIDVDLTSLAVAFRATPISAVPVVPTALSKNLSGPLSLSELQGEPKTGYLTMDHTRKLVLVLESDPKVASLPLVGIWLSGLHSIHDPFVWASCLRYLYNSTLQDRVCRPPESFLVVLYSQLHSQPEFYSCVTTDSKTALSYSLHSCHEVISLPKDSPVRPRSPLEVELVRTSHGGKMETFHSALQENSDLMAAPAPLKQVLSASLSGSLEEIVPRTTPAPRHNKEFISSLRPSVPEVSLLLDENDLHKPRPHPQPYPTPHASVTQPPYPAAFKEKKSKHKTGHPADGSHMRSPLRTVNGVPPHAALQAGYNYQAQGQWAGSGAAQGYDGTVPRVVGPQQAWTQQQWVRQAPPQPPPPPLPAQHLAPQYQGQPRAMPPQPFPAGNVANHPQPQYMVHGGVGPCGPMRQPLAYPHPAQNQAVPRQGYAASTPYPQTQFNQSLPAYTTQGAVLPAHTASPHSQSLPIQPPTMAVSRGQYRPAVESTPYGHTFPAPIPQQPQSQMPSLPSPVLPHPGMPRLAPAGSPHQIQETHRAVPGSQNLHRSPEGLGQSLNSEEVGDNQTSPARSNQSSSTKSSPVSSVGGVNTAQVPQEVYELLKQQDSQLKALRGQLDQLLLKQSEAEQQSQPPQNAVKLAVSLKELSSIATQSSPASSPVKKGRNVAEMAVNTSLWWPQSQSQNGLNNTHTTQTSHDQSQSQILTQNGNGRLAVPVIELNSSQKSHDTTHTSGSKRADVLNYSQQSARSQDLQVSASKQKLSPSHHTSGTPPRPPSASHSPCQGTTDAINQMLSNDTGSMSELQLNNLHDRTDDSYMSMVVDMPGCPSLSPEKSPQGGSLGYGGLDDSNRSPVLGESVSMYEQLRHNETLQSLQAAGRTINQSKDTGLGDSHPQVSLLYKNQHEFYNNLLGSVNKFLTKHPEEHPASPAAVHHAPHAKPDVDRSIDVAAQTREQLKRLGINTDELDSNDQTFRNDSTILFNPKLLPKINYVSMMLDSDSDLSADADSLAMKYLSDDQLAELARMRLGGAKGKRRHHHDPALERMTDRTHSEENANHLSFASKKYMERYGLLGSASGDQVGASHAAQNQQRSDSDESMIDPALQNAKALLERLKENSFLNNSAKSTISSATPHHSGSSHSSYSSSSKQGVSHNSREAQYSVTSDTTAYHSPNHTPHSHRKQRGSCQDNDRSIDSTHSAPSLESGAGGLHLLTDSAKTRGTPFKADRNQFNFSHRSHPPQRRPGSGDRILDIERLKELPKLL